MGGVVLVSCCRHPCTQGPLLLPARCRAGVAFDQVVVRWRELTITGMVEVKVPSSPHPMDKLRQGWKVRWGPAWVGAYHKWRRETAEVWDGSCAEGRGGGLRCEASWHSAAQGWLWPLMFACRRGPSWAASPL